MVPRSPTSPKGEYEYNPTMQAVSAVERLMTAQTTNA